VFAAVRFYPAPDVGNEALTHTAALARLVVSVLVGGVVFAGLALALKAQELRWLVHRPGSVKP
jgi:hypothetical protein